MGRPKINEAIGQFGAGLGCGRNPTPEQGKGRMFTAQGHSFVFLGCGKADGEAGSLHFPGFGMGFSPGSGNGTGKGDG